MIDPRRAFLERANESLDGARNEYAAGRYHNCANRTYYACFQGAIHALQSEGFLPTRNEWGHEFVERQFVGQLINRRHIYPTVLRQVLEQNRDVRVVADYRARKVTRVHASRALQRATAFVQAIVMRTEGRP